MLHHTHNTEAFVLTSLPAGESSRFVYLFTREIGLVGAHAQSAREGRSKMRYALDHLSLSKVSLVRGKNTWRITNATPEDNFFFEFRSDHGKLIACANIFAIVRKLVVGEEKNNELFELLKEALMFLKSDLSPDDIKSMEAILMLRVLNNLGYFGQVSTLDQFVATTDWNPDLLSDMRRERRSAILAINKSLKESHMI